MVNSAATYYIVLSVIGDDHWNASRVMTLKTKHSVSPPESERRDARCVGALLGLYNVCGGLTEKICTTYDESVGDQV